MDFIKKNIKLIIGIVIVLIVALFGYNYYISSTEKDSRLLKKLYENLEGIDSNEVIKLKMPITNNITLVEQEKIFDVLNSKSGVVVFASPTCEICRNIIVPLIETTKEKNVRLYYIEAGNYSEDDATYQRLLKQLDKYLPATSEGEKYLMMPDVYFLKDGKIQSHYFGAVDTLGVFPRALSDEENEKLKTIYRTHIEMIK